MPKSTVDDSELRTLTAQIGKVSDLAGAYSRKALQVSAHNLRDSWRESASGMVHAPAFPSSITYDVTSFAGFGGTVAKAEIGPDKGRPQGALGNLIEYGSVNNPPQLLGQAALEATMDDFVKGQEMALERAEQVAFTDSSFGRQVGAVIRGGY